MMKLVVLTCVLAAATANLIGAPWGIGAGLGIRSGLSVAAPLGVAAPLEVAAPLGVAASLGYASGLWGSNYRGPLSLAPGQPANIIAADGRPLDTLEVNLDRTAHATAKALEGSWNGGVHLLKKRSAPLIAPLAVNQVALAPAPLLASAPLLTGASLLARGPLSYPVPLLSAGVIGSPYNIAALDC